MLKNINSLYIVKILFSYVIEKQKLKFLKYNKMFQKNMNISIQNYIHLTRKYIIYEANGKGKEYNERHELIFEGEYLYGERSGKGKDYFLDDRIEFEGEYLNGKRSGKGKKYFSDGRLEF